MNITEPLNISIIAYNFFEFKNVSLIIMPRISNTGDIFGAFSVVTLLLCVVEILGISGFIFFCIKRVK